MACVGRLAGAILAETEGRWFLIGNTKEPCDFRLAGFEPPPEIDALKQAYIALTVAGTPRIDPLCLTLALEGDALAQLLARRFLIVRNGSVSDRLWRLVIDVDEEDEMPEADEIDAQWLAEVPDRVWEIVRDTVLRCL
ncbi:MAG: precorrin-3B C(17)-methyltransferase [Gammaproteobacteria bacterium]